MPISDTLTSNPLPLLAPHLPTLIISTLSFFSAQYLTHRLSPRLFGSTYTSFDDRTKKSWASHSVSMIHALVIIPLAIRCLGSEILKEDPVFGYDPMVGFVLALTSGYFIWDTVDSLLNSTIGFVVHGAACLAVFLFSFRPFLAGFGPPFLLWELSTPFLNIHWFMDKLKLSDSHPTLHLVNALLFILVFFLARIVYGGYNTVNFFYAMWTQKDKIPLHLHIIYCSGNIALNILNWMWFSKMVSKMISRISGDDTPIDSKTKAKSRSKKQLKEGSETTPLILAEEEESLRLPANPPSPVSVVRREEEDL